MMQLLDRIAPGFRPTPGLLVAAVAIGAAGGVIAFNLGSLGEALLAPSVEAESADPLAEVAKESEEFFAASKRRFDGRSVYALPTPPVRRPRVVEQPRPVEPPKDPGPPPPPATYAGPAPTSIIGDVVVFTDLPESDRRIRVGETKSGITVIESNGPFTCKLGHLGGTYVVSLFPRVDSRFLRGAQPSGTPAGIVPVASGSNSGAAGAATPAAPAAPGAVTGPPPANGGPALDPNGNPLTAGPAAPLRQGGSDGSAPDGGLPSPAMLPQRLPTPVAPPGEPGTGQGPAPAGSGDSGQNAGEEYVDRSLLPPRRTPEEIQAMTVAAAQSALAAIEATAGWNVDTHSRAQLDYERELLVARIHRGP